MEKYFASASLQYRDIGKEKLIHASQNHTDQYGPGNRLSIHLRKKPCRDWWASVWWPLNEHPAPGLQLWSSSLSISVWCCSTEQFSTQEWNERSLSELTPRGKLAFPSWGFASDLMALIHIHQLSDVCMQ